MKEYLIKTGDLFEIERRIREIDSEYELYFNKKTERFEVYKRGALMVVCPFESLDCRLISFLRKTRVERSKDIFDEIDEHNEKLIEKARKTQEERAKYSAIEKLNKLKSKL